MAVSTLPSPVVPLADLRARKSVIGTSIQAFPEYLDPAGTRNCYLFRQYRNGLLNKATYLQNDEFTDGKPNAGAWVRAVAVAVATTPMPTSSSPATVCAWRRKTWTCKYTNTFASST